MLMSSFRSCCPSVNSENSVPNFWITFFKAATSLLCASFRKVALCFCTTRTKEKFTIKFAIEGLYLTCRKQSSSLGGIPDHQMPDLFGLMPLLFGMKASPCFTENSEFSQVPSLLRQKLSAWCGTYFANSNGRLKTGKGVLQVFTT